MAWWHEQLGRTGWKVCTEDFTGPLRASREFREAYDWLVRCKMDMKWDRLLHRLADLYVGNWHVTPLYQKIDELVSKRSID